MATGEWMIGYDPNVLDGRKPWDRQQNESGKAYAAFKVYRDLGPDRSVRAAAARLGKHPSTFAVFCSQWGWVDRVAAWERHEEHLANQEREQQTKEMTARHATIAMLMQQKVLDKLQTMTQKDIDAMSLGDLCKLVSTSEAVERRARGEPDSISRSTARNTHEGPDGGPVQIEVVETIVRTRKEFLAVMANPEAEILGNPASG